MKKSILQLISATFLFLSGTAFADANCSKSQDDRNSNTAFSKTSPPKANTGGDQQESTR